MIVKLKCIDNKECEGYLTNGKIYSSVITPYGYQIEDDWGYELSVSVNDRCACNHGKWEAVKDDY